MWEVYMLGIGFILGSLFGHLLSNFLLNERLKLLGQLKIDLEDLYARLKGLAKNAV